MPQIIQNRPPAFTVPRADLVPIPPEGERTRLGRKLMELVAEVDASDDPPMSESDLQHELALRRGGFSYDER